MARPFAALAVKFSDLKEREYEIKTEDGSEKTDWRGMLEHKGMSGVSNIGLFTSIRLTQRVHERLYREEEEYRDYFDFASLLSKAFWIDEMGGKIYRDRNLNASMYRFIMQNRYGWKTQDEPKKEDKSDESDEPVTDLATKHKKKSANAEATAN